MNDDDTSAASHQNDLDMEQASVYYAIAILVDFMVSCGEDHSEAERKIFQAVGLKVTGQDISSGRNQERKVNINDVFPSDYLKASDLKGKIVKVRIEAVEVKKIGDDRKLVIKFLGKDKGLALNKTNASIIASSYSPETEGWIDKEIELRPDKTQFQGQTVDCIRVQVPVEREEDDSKARF